MPPRVNEFSSGNDPVVAPLKVVEPVPIRFRLPVNPGLLFVMAAMPMPSLVKVEFEPPVMTPARVKPAL